MSARTDTTYRSKRWLVFVISLLFSVISYSQTVIAIATPGPTNDTLRICAPTTITYQSLSIGFSSPVTTWAFPGGSTLTGNGNGPHLISYNTPGSFYATVVVVDGFNVYSDTIYVEVSNNTPTVTYTPPSTTFCSSNSPFALTGGSPAGGTYSGPGVTNNIFDPEAAGPGTHTICYTYTNAGGCSATDCQTFTLTAGPDASIEDQNLFTPFSNCVTAGGSPVYNLIINNISSTQATNTSYYIDWGDGSSPYSDTTLPNGTSHTYTALGNYTITVVVTGSNGCADTNTYNFFNGQNPNVGIGIGASQGCVPFTLDVPILNTANNPPGTTYQVEFGDGTVMIFNHPPPDTVSYTYTTTSCGTTDLLGNPNSYYVRIRATNPCGTTQALASPIEVSQAPVLNLQASDSTICVGQTVQLSDLSDSAFYVSNGNCNTNFAREWIVTPSTGWSISSTTSQSPTLTFTDTGSYQICIAVQHPCGNDTACIDVCVSDVPQLDIQAQSNGSCYPLDLTLWNNSTMYNSCFPTETGYVIDGNNSSYSAINGTSIDDDSAVFRFDTTGTYTVSYYAVNQCDSVFWDTVVEVGGPPVVDVPADQYFCELGTFELADFGSDVNVDLNNSTLIEYRWHISPNSGWTFANGSTNNDQNPEVTFSDTGTYIICLAVETECGTDSACFNVTFNEGPEITVSPDTTICYNGAVSLGVGVLTGTPPYQYRWRTAPPSGFTSNSDSIHLSGLTSTTTYTVTVEDSLGCETDTTVTVFVNPELIAEAGADMTICAGDTFTLNGSASGGTPPYSYYWSPGNILSDSTLLNPTSVIDGDTTFYFFVTDSLGCTAFDSVRISVYQPILNVDAGNDTLYCNTNTIEILQGYSPPGGTWTGTGIVGTDGFNPSIAGTGTHQLIYSFTDGNGCSDQDTVEITVIDPVAPVASPDTVVCVDSDPVALSGIPTGGTWSINGPGAMLSGSSFIPSQSGTFELIYTTGYGSCELSDTIEITVHPRPDLGSSYTREICSGDSIFIVPTPNIAGSTVYWNAVSTGSVTQVNLSGTDTIADTLFNVSTSRDTVVYNVWSVGPAPTDCSGDTITITVVVAPLPNITNPTDTTEICSGDQFDFIPTSSVAGATFQYSVLSVGDSITGASSGNGSISATLFNTGVAGYVHYRVYAFGPSPSNCAGDSIDLYVHVHPLPDVNAGTNAAYCTNDSVQLNANIGAQSTFTWSPTTGLSDVNALNPFVTLTNSSSSVITQVYILTATDTATGCVNSDTVEVTIYPLPTVDAGPNQSICIGDSIQIGTSNNPAFTYNWFIPGQASFSNAGMPYVQPDSTTTYRVILTDTATGCTDSAEVTILVIEAPVAAFVAVPDSGCSPLVVQLNDSSTVGVSHEWYMNGTLFSNQANPSLTLTNTSSNTDSIVEIQLIVTSGSGCADTAVQNIIIFPIPDASFTVPTPFCAPDSVMSTFTGNAPSGSTYQWYASSPAVIITQPTDSISAFVFPDFHGTFDSTYTLSLVIQSPDGCTDSTSQTVTVFARPTAGVSAPLNGCGPATISLTSSASGNSISYNYSVSPNSGVVISDPAAAQPTITFPSSLSDSVVYTIYQLVTDSRGCSDLDSTSFVVYPTPTADFTLTPSDSCGPLTVVFSNLSSANQSGMDTSSLSFHWNFGDGNTSNGNTPSHTYVNNGTSDTSFVVSLYVTNAFGCVSDTAVDTVTVHPDPIAQFTASPQSSCAPFIIDTAVVSATDYPNANGTYTWEIIDPATGSILSSYNGIDGLNYTMVNDGDTVDIRLIVTSNFGCKADTAELPFYTIEDPRAGYTTSGDSGCAPLNVQFTDTSTTGVSHFWYVDGNLISTDQNPTYTFTNTSTTTDSTYQVTLIITSGAGCSDTAESTVTVWANPVANFTANEVCLNNGTQFTDQSTGTQTIVAWSWDFGDGNTDTVANPLHTYSAYGEYVVSLTSTDSRGCSHTYTDTVVVHSLPQADFTSMGTCGTDTLCINLPSTFVDASSTIAFGGQITQWAWDIDGDGVTDYTNDSIVHTFTSSGFIDVQLIVETEFGCTDTISKNYYILTPPQADFSLDTNYGCGPLQVNAMQLSTGTITSYSWEVYADDGSGGRIVLYNSNTAAAGTLPNFQPSNLADTTYYIELTVGNCCGFDTVARQVTVRSNPSAGLLPDQNNGCSPMTVEFQLDGQVNGSPDYIVMNYGDGIIDTVYRSPLVLPNGDTTYIWGAQAHNYNYTGPNLDTTYTVKQYVYNPCGVDSANVDITVRKASVNAFIDASATSGCAPLTVTFANASFRAQNFTWCLDYDPSTGNCLQPAVGDTLTYTYTQPGTYTVALFADDACSFDTTYLTVEVYETPNVQFTANSVCVGDTTYFINSTVANSAFINSYSWDFGDGSTSFLVNPSHVYAQAGVYPVTLIVNTTDGCPDTLTRNVAVIDGPAVNFDPIDLCFDEQPFTLNNTTDTLATPITSTFWDFGDGNTSTQFEPTHQYAVPGVYTITLIHTSISGCTDSVSYEAVIHGMPTAAFDTTKVSGGSCGAPQTYAFTNQSTGASSYFWDFHLGNAGTRTDTIVSPTVTYNTPGIYEVMLVAMNDGGCNDTAWTTIEVPPYPQANFEIDTAYGCTPLTVTFTSTSSYNYPNGSIETYEWNFGDGTTTTSTIGTVSHTYTSAGVYSVSLIVTTTAGCSDSIGFNQLVRVYPRPVADFTYQVNSDGTIQFNNTSQFVDANTTFHWNFGDGTYSTEDSPLHDFDANRYEQDHYFDVCLTVQNPYGCPDSICLTVELLSYQLVVPNAFAPDLIGVGDGNVFLPKGNSIVDYHLEIFDAYGNKVFESTELSAETGIPTESWNGTFMNKGEDELPSGAYVWKISAVFVDGYIWPGKKYNDGRVLRFGTVTLIR